MKVHAYMRYYITMVYDFVFNTDTADIPKGVKESCKGKKNRWKEVVVTKKTNQDLTVSQKL